MSGYDEDDGARFRASLAKLARQGILTDDVTQRRLLKEGIQPHLECPSCQSVWFLTQATFTPNDHGGHRVQVFTRRGACSHCGHEVSIPGGVGDAGYPA